MTIRKSEIIEQLACQLVNLPQPIHLLAIYSGGLEVGQGVFDYLKDKKLKVDYFEVRLNKVNGISQFGSTDFKTKSYSGTVVLIEDAVNNGLGVEVIKQELTKLSSKKVYVAALIDWKGKCDFAVIV